MSGTHWDGPPLEAWRPWTPAQAARVLAGLTSPWCVVGGWSIDLFLGEVTREHEDLEIAVLRSDFAGVRDALDGFCLFSVGDGEVRELPAGAEPPPDRHQNWVLDPEDDEWRMDVMLEPGDVTTWVFRRDESLTAPRSFMVGRTGDGIPFLQPQGTLLFKAKQARPKDEADLEHCLPRLDDDQRTWLREAVERLHPGHPWLARL